MAVKKPGSKPLNRIDALLLGVGLAVGAFASACGVYAVFYSGEGVGQNGATNAFAAIACAGLGLAVYGAMRGKRAVAGLGLIFTALAPAGLAWLAGMLSALIGVVLIVRASSFVDLLFDREQTAEEAGEDAGNEDPGNKGNKDAGSEGDEGAGNVD